MLDRGWLEVKKLDNTTKEKNMANILFWVGLGTGFWAIVHATIGMKVPYTAFIPFFFFTAAAVGRYLGY